MFLICVRVRFSFIYHVVDDGADLVLYIYFVCKVRDENLLYLNCIAVCLAHRKRREESKYRILKVG